MTTQDVFISYTHVDNDALLEEQEGWVSILQRALQKRMSQLLGRTAQVWWDRRRLEGNSYLDEAIAEACRSSTIMLSVVTPRYLKSEYCQAEVEYFAQVHELRVGHRSRLFACVKTPVERADLLPQLQGRLGYEFFRFLENPGHFREYDVYDPVLKPLFMERLEDLAQDMAKLVLDFEPRTGAGPSSVDLKRSAGQRIVLATIAADVAPVREGIVRELAARGHHVLPEAAWSEQLLEFERELDEAAEGAQLSVHILGAGYGTRPEDASASYPELQYARIKQLAQKRAPSQPLARILWIPPGVEVTSERQRAFLEQVRADENLGALDELLEGSEDELRERIIAKLEQLARLAHSDAHEVPDRRSINVPPSAPPEAIRKVYVISADGEELSHVTRVEKHLGNEGFDVISSQEVAEEQSEPAREALHQQWLEACDGCLIFHGKSTVKWVRAQVDEVRKSLGRRHDPMRGHAVYVAPPLDGLKQRYEVQFPKLAGGSDPGPALEPFVHQLSEGALGPTSASGLDAAGADHANSL